MVHDLGRSDFRIIDKDVGHTIPDFDIDTHLILSVVLVETSSRSDAHTHDTTS